MTETPPKRIPRMRTAAKIVAEIRSLDHGSEVTEYWVRQIIKSGEVPVVWAGCKALVNLDDVLALLALGTSPPRAGTLHCGRDSAGR